MNSTRAVSKRARWHALPYPAVIITPGRAAYLCVLWLLPALARLAVGRFKVPLWQTAVVLYGAYFGLAVLMLLWWGWPRANPAVEGVRRSRRLLAVDPGMALVRGRGALEHALREAMHRLSLAPEDPSEPLGLQALLLLLQPHMPGELFQQADRLRRLANLAAHDVDWQIDRSEARSALAAAGRIARWSHRIMPGHDR